MNKIVDDSIVLLERLTGKKIILTENKTDFKTKSVFNRLAFQLTKNAEQLIEFYNSQLAIHPLLKKDLRQVENLQSKLESIILSTTDYLEGRVGTKNETNQLKLNLEEEEHEEQIAEAISLIEEMTTADMAVPEKRVLKESNEPNKYNLKIGDKVFIDADYTHRYDTLSTISYIITSIYEGSQEIPNPELYANLKQPTTGKEIKRVFLAFLHKQMAINKNKKYL